MKVSITETRPKNNGSVFTLADEEKISHPGGQTFFLFSFFCSLDKYP